MTWPTWPTSWRLWLWSEVTDRVPVLLGAAQALHERTDHKSYGYYRPDESLRERVEQQARQALGEDAYAEALQAGRDLDVNGVVRFALHRRPENDGVAEHDG